MSKLFYIMITTCFISCNGEAGDSKGGKIDTTYSISKEGILLNDNKTLLELYLTAYIDSLNNTDNEAELPLFLGDPQFDYKNRGIWKSFHSPISVREQIINRINNCRPLLLIVNSKNENFRKKPQIEENLMPPKIEMSFYDLVLKRIESLDCK